MCVRVCDIRFRSVDFTNIKMCAHKFSIFSKFIHYKSSHFHVPRFPSSFASTSAAALFVQFCSRNTLNGIVCIHTFVRSLVGLVGSTAKLLCRCQGDQHLFVLLLKQCIPCAIFRLRIIATFYTSTGQKTRTVEMEFC